MPVPVVDTLSVAVGLMEDDFAVAVASCLCEDLPIVCVLLADIVPFMALESADVVRA